MRCGSGSNRCFQNCLRIPKAVARGSVIVKHLPAFSSSYVRVSLGMLPHEMRCGCGMTCWRRLRDWQAAGLWDQLYRVLLDELREADEMDWSRAAVDSASVRALAGGLKSACNPTDRAKPGSKHHVMTDGQGIPLATILTAANVNGIEEFESLGRSHPANPRKARPTMTEARLCSGRPCL